MLQGKLPLKLDNILNWVKIKIQHIVMKVAITTSSMDIKRVIKEYYGKHDSQQFENLDEMDQFHETHSLPEFTERPG